MQLLSTPDAISRMFDELLAEHDQLSFAVAWASIEFGSYEALRRNAGKIRRGIVGTHFHQTHPDFIRQFQTHENVRFVLKADELFHPKIYLFESDESWAALMGSANFTRGGFGENREVMVLIEASDDPAGETHRQFSALLDDYWGDAVIIGADELGKYEEAWRRYRQYLQRASGRYGADVVRTPIEKIGILKLSWDEYVAAVHAKDSELVPDRAQVLREARRLFAANAHFADLSDIERKTIGGYAEPGEIKWKLFGSMHPAGRFKKQVSANRKEISHALDRIPSTGPVSRQNYLDYTEIFGSAFIDDGGDGVAVASRLLAMKRPDYFVCFDKANRVGLLRDFDIEGYWHKAYEIYWDAVIERILDSTWWNAPRPGGGMDAEIWDGRAAFVDAIYYDPDFWKKNGAIGGD